MFGMRRNKRNGNGLMMSLVGIGVGAAAYGMMRGRNNGNNNMMEPVQKAMNQFRD
ncbi:DUF3918 family protein [Bacillus shivajii]|uniref:DUF3918 family protein n=1 Tax=Bacillus shivajii TaxID=1983719 RepID=UPI001CFA3CD2|nr:DUF3918 family protein [Bacillus shivajii]UCZ54413.1 DUF3918 family protein [Bacillus shivajii]